MIAIAPRAEAVGARQALIPARSLRLAMVGPVPPAVGGATSGGVATHHYELAQRLAAGGVNLTLLATNAPAPGPNPYPIPSAPFPMVRAYTPRGVVDWLAPSYLRQVGLATLLQSGLRLARLDARLGGSRRDVLAQVLWYRRVLRLARPNVVHVQHPLERHLYVRLVREFDSWHVPVVVTLHGLFGEHPEHVLRGLMTQNLRHADALIAVSSHIAREAVQLGANPARIQVIRSGVDTARFQPRDRRAARLRMGVPPEAGVILFVGNLEPRKAVNRLIAVLPEVLRIEPRATLVVVGSGRSAGPENQEARLRSLVSQLGLERSVRFAGMVDDAALLDWYAAADVFALPSTSEAQGIVALEAMACGLPVVASAVGGLLDTIDDGRTGFLVAETGEPALAERLSALLADPAARRAVGAAARAAVERDFSWERSVTATVALYREVAAAR